MLMAMVDGHVGATFSGVHVTVSVDRSDLIVSIVRERPGSWTFADVASLPVEAPLKVSACSFGQVGPFDDPNNAWFDAEALVAPLELRPWQTGDRMRPLGLGGSKLVSDLLIDAKVPLDRKGHCYVLTSGERIAWLCGMRMAEGFQASLNSDRILQCVWTGPLPFQR
jgi:tRNA(Ile)-lysidine synthetase-like protein